MDAFFGPAGRLSGALAGFEPRPEQEARAAPVASARASPDHHVAGAGTGTPNSRASSDVGGAAGPSSGSVAVVSCMNQAPSS